MSRPGLLQAGASALLLFLWACSSTPNVPPNVVIPPPGETLASIPGPMPDFGPFEKVEDAIAAACPILVSQPDAIIPVSKDDDNFRLYWNLSREYCAWLYSPDGKNVEMSLLTASAVQDDPTLRQCQLPARVIDARHSPEALVYLVVIHSHPFDDPLSDKDLIFLSQVAQLHGFTPTVNGTAVPVSIVAFFGRFKAGKPTCSGYYQYLPADSSQVVRRVVGEDGRWKTDLLGRIKWDNGIPYLER